jgi:hypothetical protein
MAGTSLYDLLQNENVKSSADKPLEKKEVRFLSNLAGAHFIRP